MPRGERWRDDDDRWERRDVRMRESPDFGQGAVYDDDRYGYRDRPRYADERRDYRHPQERRGAPRHDDDYDRRHPEQSSLPFRKAGATGYGFGPGFVDPGLGVAPFAPVGFPYENLYGRGDRPERYGERREDGHGRYGAEAREHEPRSWAERARDEVSSWFGDRDAERRREADEVRASHRGRGPKGYRRSDERIREDISDRLTEDPWLDASDIEVTVLKGEVTLSGLVASREDKRRAERLAEDVTGVDDVQNNIKVRRDSALMAGQGSGRTDSF